MDVARTQLQRSEGIEQPFSSMPRSHHANDVLTATCLRCHYVHAVLTTPLLRSYCVLIRPRPHYAFLNMFKFDHVDEDHITLRQRLTSFYYAPTTSYKFLLRPSIFSRVNATIYKGTVRKGEVKTISRS